MAANSSSGAILMKIFFYMGRNSSTRSGVSWKIWKIARRGRAVTTKWGPATLDQRKPVLHGTPQEKTHRFKTVKAAIEFENRIIRTKLTKGYERRTRWR
jgi:hypothetical protein